MVLKGSKEGLRRGKPKKTKEIEREYLRIGRKGVRATTDKNDGSLLMEVMSCSYGLQF